MGSWIRLDGRRRNGEMGKNERGRAAGGGNQEQQNVTLRRKMLHGYQLVRSPISSLCWVICSTVGTALRPH
ncbi:hypothetical protein DPEC_G00200030 [Dallia pectoralis]|uniref:Uncharacterized protein n=1 Tax=Dallia pectoralis TaxID=75939 RepID=A0ACC2G8W8_DALPE|nr:hypothetical protein DPEC_G00200030 [Dallia pectoralis]